MLRHNYNLILMVFWLFIGVCLVFPEQIILERAQQHLRAPGGAVAGVGMLAFVFAAYNLARWWAFQSLLRNRRKAPRLNPLAQHVAEYEHHREEAEPNPELDFSHIPDADKPHLPAPSPNGDHRPPG